MPPPIDGPRLPARSGQASALVVFLHGYGADGRDLIEIGRQWSRLLPGAAFAAPNAPDRQPQGAGRQWFPLNQRDPSERERGVVQARPALDAYIDAEALRHGVPPGRVVLVGFSQGTMMALHTGLRRPVPPAAIVGYSGFYVRTPDELKSARTGAPPVLLIHGDRDEVIPVDALFDAADGLWEAEIPCEWHLSAGAGHSIDAEGLRHGVEFITAALKRAR